MLSFLKPTKTNVVGTVLLLAANLIGSSVSGYLTQFIIGATDLAMTDRAGPAGFGGGAPPMAAGRLGTSAGGFGIVGSALSLLVLAVLFYVTLSFVVTKLGGGSNAETKKK